MAELEKFSVYQALYQNSDLHPTMIEIRYQEEGKMLEAISRGDVEQTILFYRNFQTGTTGDSLNDVFQRFPADPLRTFKNAMVVLNTLCRIAAQKGGLNPFLINRISQKYAFIIEHSTSIDFLNNTMWPFMLMDYCQAVSEYSSYRYSTVTNAIMTYIINNLPSQLSVGQLAEQFFMNPSALSHKFKLETGSTITEFINLQRVKLAQCYLEDQTKAITEIAFMVGYTDSNYFCRVFKKITTLTPTQYLKNINKHNVLI